MGSVTPTPTTKRAWRTYGPRRVGFVELSPAQQRSAGPLLEVIGNVRRLYVVGRRPGAAGPGGGGTDGLRRWAAGELPAGWREAHKAHYLEGDHPVVRFEGPYGVLEVAHASTWFGEGDYSADDALDAWRLLGAELALDFPGCQLLGSPSATGRELFQRVIPWGREWPTLEPEHAALVRRDAGQGRIQLLDRLHDDTLPAIHVYDGRLFYAALCWGLPSGPAELVPCDEYLGQRRARYHARITVPGDWPDRCQCGAPGHAGIGLLPHRVDGELGWHYSAEPGATFTGWYDGAELHVALAHGWHVQPDTALLFPTYKGAGPLDGWAKRLIGCRERLARVARIVPAERAVEAELAARAVRNVILHTIGAFAATSHRVTRSLPIEQADEVPPDALDLRVEADRIVWAAFEEQRRPEVAHPEWAAAIWARARARLLDGPAIGGDQRRTGALKVPARTVLAFRTDSLYLTADPGWRDDGKPGRLRHVGTVAGPLTTPRTAAELLEATR